MGRVGGVAGVAHFITSHEHRLNKTEFAIFVFLCSPCFQKDLTNQK